MTQHISETLLLYFFFNLIRHARALKGFFSSLAFRKAIARNFRDSSPRRIYSYLRVVPAAMITEHHSLGAIYETWGIYGARIGVGTRGARGEGAITPPDLYEGSIAPPIL